MSDMIYGVLETFYPVNALPHWFFTIQWVWPVLNLLGIIEIIIRRKIENTGYTEVSK